MAVELTEQHRDALRPTGEALGGALGVVLLAPRPSSPNMRISEELRVNIIDKRQTLDELSVARPVQLELGCGSRKRNPQAIGVDRLDSECVDIVGDVYDVLAHFPGRTVDAITSSHFLEHIPDVERLIDEMARVLTDGGQLEVVVPHFSNSYFYSDATHRQCFGLYTFSYYAVDRLLSRKVPHYGRTPEFELVSIDLCFKSPRPFYGRYVFKRLVGLIINSCYYIKELYEENISFVLPCYEVRYILRRLPRPPQPRVTGI